MGTGSPHRMGHVDTAKQTPEKMNSLDDIREAILNIVAERLSLEQQSREQLRINGRMDRFTAVDSLLIVELVLMLEERFQIRFDPEHINVELVSDIDALATFIFDLRQVT